MQHLLNLIIFPLCSIEDVWRNDFGRRKSLPMCNASSITLVYLRLFIKLTHTLEFILHILLCSLNDYYCI